MFSVTRPDGTTLKTGPTNILNAIGPTCYMELISRKSIAVRFGDGSIWKYRVLKRGN